MAFRSKTRLKERKKEGGKRCHKRQRKMQSALIKLVWQPIKNSGTGGERGMKANSHMRRWMSIKLKFMSHFICAK
jgi:hypothetical protein